MTLNTKLTPSLIVLLVNLAATGYTIVNPKMSDKLFELYLGSTAGLYGYLQQRQTESDSPNLDGNLPREKNDA